MSKGDTFEADLLKLIFQAVDIANIADDTVTAPLTSLHVSLHTSSPGDAGNQSTNEVNTTQYQNYQRVAVARTTGGWAITGSSISPVSAIQFATAGAASTGATITNFAVGTASSGTGKLLYHGTLSPSITISEGVTPQITTSSTITED